MLHANATEFGALLRARRTALELTQGELARTVGTRQPNIAAIETGVRSAGPELRSRLLHALSARPSTILERHRAQLLEAARANGVTDVRVFGSIARGEDGPDSDIDLLVRLPTERPARALLRFAAAAEAALGVHVDVLPDSQQSRVGSVLLSARAEAVPV